MHSIVCKWDSSLFWVLINFMEKNINKKKGIVDLSIMLVFFPSYFYDKIKGQ